MRYDPVKNKIGRFVNRAVWLRKLFYRSLDILLLRTWHVKKALREFEKEYPNEANILDAGMGFGQYSWRMSRMNSQWKIEGVDVKQEQIDDCNRFFQRAGVKASRVSFEYADLAAYNKEGNYDLVLSVDVMEHIVDDQAVFNNFSRSLKEGGWLIISTPSDRGGSDVNHDHDDSFIDEHVRDGYSIDGISHKLRKAGFEKVVCRYTYGKPGKVSWKLSMKYPVLMLNKSWLFAIILPIWYIVLMPVALLLNFLDVRKKHREGTGLLVVAVK